MSLMFYRNTICYSTFQSCKPCFTKHLFLNRIRWQTDRVVRRCTSEDEETDVVKPEDKLNVSPVIFISVNSVFYGAMTLSSVALGNISGVDVLENVKSPVNTVGSLIWLAPMIVSLLVSVRLVDRFPQLQKIQTIIKTAFLPALSKLPPWGPAVIAFGAGIGEEVFFRGWLQPVTINSLSTLPPELSIGFGVFFTSVLFGLCHFVTETYFIWATLFGALFGIESLQIGLPAAILTHSLYDWFAFVYIQEMWKTSNSD